MTITPMDIQNKEFERSFRGYDIEDVDEFLDRVAKDLEQMTRENMELKEQLSELQEKNKSYQKLEETMHSAIVVAQETAEEVKQNAKREADLIKRESEREAQRLIEDARHRSSRILSEQEELFKQARVFKMRFRSFIEAQLASLENEDWLLEAYEGQDAEDLKRDFAPGPRPEVSTDYEYEKKTDFNSRFGHESKPEDESKPEFDPNPEFEPKYGLETAQEDDPKKDKRPRWDRDFDSDPEF